MAFQGEVVLITGAASGMGRLAAQRMAKGGAKVAAIDLNEEGLRQTASADPERIRVYPQDVTDVRGVSELVARIEREQGAIDRVYNAAAIMPTGLLLDQSPELINRITEINYFGTVNVTMATLPRMLQRGRGDLIQFASVAGWTPTLHFGAYNASKFAVVAFADVLYHENRGKGVRMVCVCPPPVATPLLDQAKSQPKILDAVGPPLAPDAVLDAIEQGLERGNFWVFPGRGTGFGVALRRWFPGLVWRFAHRIEGI